MVHEARVKVTESIQATLCFRHPSSLRVNEALNGVERIFTIQELNGTVCVMYSLLKIVCRIE